MLGALVADEIGLGKISISVAAVTIWKLLTEKFVIGLPLSIVWGNTLVEWANVVQNNYSGIIGEDREWYPLKELNSVSRLLVEIQITSP